MVTLPQVSMLLWGISGCLGMTPCPGRLGGAQQNSWRQRNVPGRGLMKSVLKDVYTVLIPPSHRMESCDLGRNYSLHGEPVRAPQGLYFRESICKAARRPFWPSPGHQAQLWALYQSR